MKRQQGDVEVGGGGGLNASKPPLTRLAPGLKYLSPCVRALFFLFFLYDLQLTGGSDSQRAAARLAPVGRPPGAAGPPGLPDATSADPDPRLPTSTPPLDPSSHPRRSQALQCCRFSSVISGVADIPPAPGTWTLSVFIQHPTGGAAR